MRTTAQLHFKDAGDMAEVPSGSIQLIVTSPPYPMIEMWDTLFSRWDEQVEVSLQREQSEDAFRRMHELLRSVWSECYRTLQDGGLLCVNIGDATRSLNGSFELFPNHSWVQKHCVDLGFQALPGILWRKSTNKPTKFMGSGMVAPNAYVTLEHEHILIFRKGEKRDVSPSRRNDRYESAYFWEERNRWFSDVWTNLAATGQNLPETHQALRSRSAAYPVSLPLRLIHMFSIYGDTVLDPFWGTGTTSIAAALSGRNSVGYEVDEAFRKPFRERAEQLPQESRSYLRQRLKCHFSFVEQQDDALPYNNEPYDTPVATRQEEQLQFYEVVDVRQPETDQFTFGYAPFDGVAADSSAAASGSS